MQSAKDVDAHALKESIKEFCTYDEAVVITNDAWLRDGLGKLPGDVLHARNERSAEKLLSRGQEIEKIGRRLVDLAKGSQEAEVRLRLFFDSELNHARDRVQSEAQARAKSQRVDDQSAVVGQVAMHGGKRRRHKMHGR